MALDRYARQLRAMGPEAHVRIRKARVLVVGLGGLGCPAAMYLAGAGVARLGLCDPDRVDVTNLPRQPLYTTADAGRFKVQAARRRLAAMNPDVSYASIRRTVRPTNALDVVAGWDLVLDCTDSMEARYALSDACSRLRIPLVQAGIAAGESQVALLCGPAPGAPCYRCAFPAAAGGPSCADEGILGPVAGLAGTLQALWALRWVAGDPEARSGRMTLVDAWGSASSVELTRRAGCEAHVDDAAQGPACPMPWNAPQTVDVPVHELANHLKDSFILDVREPDEFEEGHIPGAYLLPLGQLPRRLAEVPKDRTVVCVCAVGGRSAHATAFLRQQGYSAVNLRGGMRAWHLAGMAA